MKKVIPVLAAVGLAALFAVAGFKQSGQMDRKALRETLTQLGYAVKDMDSTAGRETYSFTIQREGLNIPVAAEISANDKFIWLSVFCKDGDPTGEKAVKLLHLNADLQPAQFYITKNKKVMLALFIANRDVTNAELRDSAEKIVTDVVNTKGSWQ